MVGTMADFSTETIMARLKTGPFRVLPVGKQLTLAFGGLYIASTTLAAKPMLIWETEKSFPRYYVPAASLHRDVQVLIFSGSCPVRPDITLEKVEQVGQSGQPEPTALIEELTVGSKTLRWARFAGGLLDGYIRFERND